MVYSESEIVHELEAGNEVCLNMLFDNYYRSLCVYAFRFVSDGDDVEDIVQEASKFATRRGKIKFDDVEKYVDQFLEELGEYDENEFARLRDKVYARVEALPGKTKEIFKAVVLDNMTYQQVGERFGITVNTVKTMYYRALKQLKEELGGNALVLFFIIRR